MDGPELQENLMVILLTDEGSKVIFGAEKIVVEKEIARGREEGRTKGKVEMVQNLLRMNQFSLETIAQVSGFTTEQLMLMKSRPES